jgi:hypothetical protein
MDEELVRFREGAKALGVGKQRRYGRELIELGRRWARRQLGLGKSGHHVAMQLGVPQHTLRRWLGAGVVTNDSPKRFVRVRCESSSPTPHEALRVLGPSGLVVEGLGVSEVAQLWQALEAQERR